MDRPLQTQQDNIRLSLYQEDTSALPGETYGSYLGQSFVNCFPMVERNAITGETSVLIVKRQGTTAVAEPTPTIASYGTPNSMSCVCNMVMTQLYDVYVAAFFDAANSKIYFIQYRPISGTTEKIGEITGCDINDTVFITEIVNGDTLLPAIAVSYQKASKASGKGYYAVSSGGVFTASTLTPISHTSFPANLGTPRIVTGPFQYMNGHTYIMTLDGFIYMSSLTTSGNPDITTWNTLATVTASQYPDSGIGVWRYKHHLIAFGKDSVEFFNDASNPPPGSTLERTDQAFIKFGAINPRMIQNFDDSIYWVAYGSNNSFGVWKMTGYAPEKISILKIDQALMDYLSQNSDNSIINMQCLVLGGRKHLLINGIPYTTQVDFIASDAADTNQLFGFTSVRAGTVAYNLEDKVWWGLNAQTNYYQSFPRPATSYNTTTQAGNYRQYLFHQPQTSTSGDDSASCRIMYFRQAFPSSGQYIDEIPTAENTPIAIAFCTNTYWFQNERRKRISRLRVICDGLSVGGADASVYAMYAVITRTPIYDSTGATQLVRRIPIPTDNQRYYVNNLGMMRSLSVGVACVSKDDFRARAIELDIGQGTQ